MAGALCSCREESGQSSPQKPEGVGFVGQENKVSPELGWAATPHGNSRF